MTTNDLQPPIVNYGDGGNWTDWTRSIDEILKMEFDVAIPGHGPAVSNWAPANNIPGMIQELR